MTISKHLEGLEDHDEHSILGIPLVHGLKSWLRPHVLLFVKKCASLCRPDKIHIMDGSKEEDERFKRQLVDKGVLIPLPKYDNCYLARTDPRDVARTEGRTFMCTDTKEEAIPTPAEGVEGKLGNWISPGELEQHVYELFPGCMMGRTMIVIPFSMGPIGSPLSKIGIEITDSTYVGISMRIMTRVGKKVLDVLGDAEFIQCLHSVGVPIVGCNRCIKEDVLWPCNPEKVLVAHKPATKEIFSYGSGYGGNSLLGKKCLALRIGSTLGKKEGWLAEHMLIAGVEGPGFEKMYITAAFPSACGKTNLAMMSPKIPGYKVTCVGDDIAWIRADSNGCMRAIQPENGFFGVAPGTSFETNPVAMQTIFKDTVFSNVALTPDGGVWWEGMGDKPKSCIDWKGNPWTPESKTKAAHPNSRFCSPMANCPSLDPAWDDTAGVPISAMLFGGRRPDGVPLVYQSFSWEHGVFLGACIKSESTAAAEHKQGVVLHDPFSMRPFFGYNFGDYIRHWFEVGKSIPIGKHPQIFMVNWFRKDKQGKFIWPGFGENIRIIEWILKRVTGKLKADMSCVGYVPKLGDINLEGLEKIPDMKTLMSTPAQIWKDEAKELRKYFEDQVGTSLPQEIWKQLWMMEQRVILLASE